MASGCWAVAESVSEKPINLTDYSKLSDADFQIYIKRLYDFGGGDTAPASLSELLCLYMKNAGITVEELAFECKISERTLGAMRNQKGYRPKLRNLIAICICLHLKPSYSYRLLESAGYRLTDSYEDTIYRCLLDNLYMCDLETSNKFLIKAKMKPL